MIVLHAELLPSFELKVVGLQGHIFYTLYNFATKLCNFTKFTMFFLAVAFDLLFLQ